MPAVTLTTDFGTRDAFVAAMKGVILGIAPDATIVDVTHEIAPRDVWGGALALAQAAPFFPAGTVHVAVVDPGVGSERAGLVIDGGAARYVGPDNGVLTLAAPAGAPCFRIEDPALARDEVSATFHGRDLFAPVAARLVAGLAASRVGPVHEPARLAWPEEPQVVHVDRFGNLVTSLRGLPPGTRAVEVDGLGRAPLGRTYADVEPGALVAYVGGAGLVEIGVRDGSAADRLGCCVPGRGPRGLPARVIP